MSSVLDMTDAADCALPDEDELGLLDVDVEGTGCGVALWPLAINWSRRVCDSGGKGISSLVAGVGVGGGALKGL